MNKDQITMICSYCGSEDVSIEANVYWDVQDQELKVGDMFDKGHYCSNCNGITKIHQVACKDYAEYLALKEKFEMILEERQSGEWTEEFPFYKYQHEHTPEQFAHFTIGQEIYIPFLHQMPETYTPTNATKTADGHGHFDLCDQLEQIGILKKMKVDGNWVFFGNADSTIFANSLLNKAA